MTEKEQGENTDIQKVCVVGYVAATVALLLVVEWKRRQVHWDNEQKLY